MTEIFKQYPEKLWNSCLKTCYNMYKAWLSSEQFPSPDHNQISLKNYVSLFEVHVIDRKPVSLRDALHVTYMIEIKRLDIITRFTN